MCLTTKADNRNSLRTHSEWLLAAILCAGLCVRAVHADGISDLRGFGVCNITKEAWPLATELGAGWWRTPPIVWGNVEFRRGQITFDRLDKVMRQTQEANLVPVVPFICNSSWGTPLTAGEPLAAPTSVRSSQLVYGFPKSCFPVDINAWQRFVREVVERYDYDGHNDMPGLKMRAQFWQLGREIPTEWADTPFRLVDFLQITWRAIREADPQAVLILPGIESRALAMLAFADGELRADDKPLGYDAPREGVRKMAEFEDTRRFIEVVLQIGKGFFDVLDTHLLGQDVLIPGKMRWIRNLMRRSNCEKPIIALEAGGPIVGSEGEYSNIVNAEQTAKVLCAALENGVVGMAFPLSPNFPGTRSEYQMLTLLAAGASPKPSYFTLKMLMQLVRGYESVGPIDHKKRNIGYVFRRTRGDVYVLWSDEVYTLRLPVESRNFRVYHIITQPGQTEPATGVLSTDITRKSKLTQTPVVLVDLSR